MKHEQQTQIIEGLILLLLAPCLVQNSPESTGFEPAVSALTGQRVNRATPRLQVGEGTFRWECDAADCRKF